MSYYGRRDFLEKAFLTIDALNRRNGVTSQELACTLNLTHCFANHDYRAAQRWIDAASLILPVAEIGERRFNGAIFGRPSTVYKIINRGENERA